jgi:hypothetical protein
MASHLYGLPGAVATGPTYEAAAAGSGPGLTATVTFRNGTVGPRGLTLVNATYPDDPGRLPAYNLGWPEVGGWVNCPVISQWLWVVGGGIFVFSPRC